MKRSDSLIPLSHDHHTALVTANRINQLSKDAEVEIKEYWSAKRQVILEELRSHFDIEESSFTQLLQEHNTDFLMRLTDDHQYLITLLEDSDYTAALTFATALKQHVRFEERELFPWLQEHYSEQFLERVMNS